MQTRHLLYCAHALDHLVLLIFAAAVSAIAADFGFVRWEDLMPYTTGAFVMFGLASLPAGRYGDLWGRRAMMLLFYFGLGVSCIAVALTLNAWQMAMALTVMGVFAAIYHPVGIPMLLQNVQKPGAVIGVNGLAGNLGIALAAVLTGFLVKYFGWRAAFAVPGVVSVLLGVLFLRVAPSEGAPPARRSATRMAIDRALAIRVFVVLTLTTTFSGIVFNFTTNGNAELLRERVSQVASDPAAVGMLLASAYVIASFAQVVVGRLIDRYPVRSVFIPVAIGQTLSFLLAAHASGWLFYAALVSIMVFVFGAIPFTDALIVRFVDDGMRSRVAGLRLAISFGLSAVAVWLLGPMVKAAGFSTLLLVLTLIGAATAIAAVFLPRTDAAS
jgi:MFS family permease